MTPHEKMKNARIKLLLNRPFIGSMTMGIVYQPVSMIPTACITGPEIFYNPDWIDTLNIRQTEGLWAHEVYHVGFLHNLRQNGRDQELWFYSCDFPINGLLLKDKFELPPGGCYGVPELDGFSAERVYDFLEKQRQQQGKSVSEFIQDMQKNGLPSAGISPPQQSQPAPGQKKGPAPGSTSGKPTPKDEKASAPPSQSTDSKDKPQKQAKSTSGHEVADQQLSDKMHKKLSELSDKNIGIGGTMEPLNEKQQPLSKDEKRQIEKQIEVKIMVSAEIGSETWGDIPGFAKEIVKNIEGDAQRDYRDELRDVFVEVTKDDYTWAKPNRRYIAQGIYMPSIGGENKGTLVIAIDTSGSVGHGEKEVYAAEISSILEDFPQLALYVIYSDTGVRHVQEFESGEGLPLELEFRGGGGTSFHDVFKHIEEKQVDPKLLLFFSDLCVGNNYPEHEPDYPVIWLQTVKGSKQTMRWGKVLELDPNLPKRT